MSSVPVDMLDYYDEEVVRRIIEKYGYGEREALGLFLESQTYSMLTNPLMEMWQLDRCAEFVCEVFGHAFTVDQLLASADRYGKSPYGEHLRAVAYGRVK